ncbi:MAG: asparagine synthase C-terminal domain-containing protein [Burkholderiaceae bacterium]|nr:asparagine synthase C-terminal domain-containing protein [Burkholderiaceae bacterium]
MRLDVDLAALASGTLADATRLQLNAHEGLSAQNADKLVLVIGQPRTGETVLSAADLLQRHARMGAGLAEGLHGAYAIAVVDAAKRQLLLFNDRMAVHGWCYAGSGGRLRVSDRADTLADGAAIDPQAIFTYLFNHVIPAPDTIYSGVRRLPPGHRLVADAQGTVVEPHWQPVFSAVEKPDFDALKDEFRGLLQSAVAREAQRFGSGAVGTFLSGGTDSSTVSGMLRKVTDGTVHAYSIGFDADGYDEMDYARLAARHFGLNHHEHYLTADEVATGMPQVATHYDQPFGNSSAVAAYHCARVAREDGRTALLAGDGGDELFGGNARYAKQRLFGLYEHIPAPLRSLVMQPLLDNRVAERLPGLSKAASYVQQARVPMPDRLHMYNLLARLGLAQVLTPAFLAQVNPGHDQQAHRAVYARSAGASQVNRMLAYDWKYTLADNDLPKVIGTTTLAGIATAFPLLADEVLDFSLKLPDDYKLKGQQLRWFFKEALRGFLPDDILAKKKQGFGLPFGVWALKHPQLARLADDALGSFGTRGVVQPAFMHKLRTELLPAHPGYYGELVWIVAMLELWLRERAPQWRQA